MLYLKIMSSEDLPDSNTSKKFTLIPLREDEYIETDRFENGIPYLVIKRRGFNGGMEFRMEGNAYILEANKTIASYAHYSAKH